MFRSVGMFSLTYSIVSDYFALQVVLEDAHTGTLLCLAVGYLSLHTRSIERQLLTCINWEIFYRLFLFSQSSERRFGILLNGFIFAQLFETQLHLFEWFEHSDFRPKVFLDLFLFPMFLPFELILQSLQQFFIFLLHRGLIG